MTTRILSALTLALLIAAPTHAQQVVTNGNKNALSTTNRVIIASYFVEFQQQLDARSSSNRFLGAGRVNSVAADNTLTGVDAATYQRITETGYAALVESLRAAGYVVVRPEEYATLPDAQTLKSRAAPAGQGLGNGDGKSVLYGAAGLLNVLPDLESGDHLTVGAPTPAGGLFGTLSNVVSGFQAVGKAISDPANTTSMLELRLAKAANAHVLKVWQVVNFGVVKAQAGVDTSSSGGGATLFLNGYDSRLSLRTPLASGNPEGGKGPEKVIHPGGLFQKRVTYTPPNDGDLVVRLNDDLVAGTGFLAGPVRDATTLDQKVGTALTVVGSLLTQTGGVTNYKSYQTPADPMKFEAVTVNLLKASQAAYLTALK